MESEQDRLQYMAAMIDSSSHIGIKCVRGSDYQLVVAITRKENEIGDMFLREFGGYRTKAKNSVVITGQKAYNMIRRIAPYVKVKRDHVLVALDFIEVMEQHNRVRRIGHSRPQAELEKRQMLFDRMKALNTRTNHQAIEEQSQPKVDVTSLVDDALKGINLLDV